MCLQAKPTKVYTKGPLETNKHVILASRELIIVQRERERERGILVEVFNYKSPWSFQCESEIEQPVGG